VFLYPAYATYKSLGRRPTDHAELERWLMYWSVVGAWTAAEGIVGWFLEW
jgi:receptor expression-enhancing protein 1/2/3/4